MSPEDFHLDKTDPEFLALVRRALLRDFVANHLNEEILNQYLALLQFTWVKAGSLIMQQGTPSDFLATVILGRVKVAREEEDGTTTTLLRLGHGQTVGEMGLVTEQPRSANVIAQRDTLLATLSRSAFEMLLKKNPIAFNRQFVRPILNRLENQLKGITTINVAPLSMVLVPTSAAVDVRPLATQLTQALNRDIAACLHIDQDYVAANLGLLDEADHVQNRRISEWLGTIESEHDVIIYTAPPEDSPWLRRCLRQADKIVLVGAGAAAPLQAEWVPALQLPEAAEQQRVLLLLQDAACAQPQGTRDWLAAFDVAYYYHLKQDSAVQLQRVARLLANRGIGLVLTGGGARGVAHAGVSKLFKEHNIPFDVVCGSSSGSVISTAIAHSWDAEKFSRLLSKPPKIRFTIPFAAISSGFGVQKWLDNAFGTLNLEDIWLPNFFPIYNMRTSELETRDRGRASTYLRASTALPGLCPPLVEGHDVYLDGGVANFMPIDIMRDRTDIHTVIAVDIVSPIKGKKGAAPHTYDGRISGWKILWNKLNPFSKRLRFVPLGTVMLNSILVASIKSHKHTRDMADFKIRLVVSDVGLLDFDKADYMAEFGYEETKKQLESSGLTAYFSNQSAAA